jgi:putative transposase
VKSTGNRYLYSASFTRPKVRMISSFLSFCLRFLKSRIQLQLEIVFLRKQLEILRPTSSRPRLRHFDRLFFGPTQDLYDGWKNALLIVKQETVIRLHQQGFKLYWRWKSRHKRGRPKIPQAQINLIKQMTNENPLWGAPQFMTSC